MPEQPYAQPDHRSAAPEDDPYTGEDLDQQWAKFSEARASLSEVMSDAELRAFGINVEVLDERP